MWCVCTCPAVSYTSLIVLFVMHLYHDMLCYYFAVSKLSSSNYLRLEKLAP
jgi:hypothetical protein